MPDQQPQGIIQLTAEQLQEIIAGSKAGALAHGQGQGCGAGAGAAASGNLPPCSRGPGKGQVQEVPA